MLCRVIKPFICWFQALIVEEPSSEPRESHPANLVSLRTQAASLRDQILRTEKEEEVKGTLNSRRSNISDGGKVTSVAAFSKATEKLRKKLAEVEANLVLASPNLVFQVRFYTVQFMNYYIVKGFYKGYLPSKL